MDQCPFVQLILWCSFFMLNAPFHFSNLSSLPSYPLGDVIVWSRPVLLSLIFQPKSSFMEVCREGSIQWTQMRDENNYIHKHL
ncbi:hypothetical protein F5882DRAFT_396011 [Hyaloscypha sp. PMI_1271]|nr:hypothetical protein F5882DRAFT_396011 [Hyaloscypha sp. PMI_1271]